VLERMAPEDFNYKHHQKWGDHNGAAHIKSALIGTDFTVPIADGQLQLGTWQQIVLIDFDEKPRTRSVIVKIISD
jgi:secondary thiamine-phosphate synthase enzyme